MEAAFHQIETQRIPPLSRWVLAVYLVAAGKDGGDAALSAKEIGRRAGVTGRWASRVRRELVESGHLQLTDRMEGKIPVYSVRTLGNGSTTIDIIDDILGR